jgi:hypothetical protein
MTGKATSVVELAMSMPDVAFPPPRKESDSFAEPAYAPTAVFFNNCTRLVSVALASPKTIMVCFS